MTVFTLTDHAAIRMAQRGMSLADAELAVLIGTEVDDGHLVLEKNCRCLEGQLKALIDRVMKLRGRRVVTASGRIVTAYHASRRRTRRLLRNAQERDLD